jgi:hypothetical protein
MKLMPTPADSWGGCGSDPRVKNGTHALTRLVGYPHPRVKLPSLAASTACLLTHRIPGDQSLLDLGAGTYSIRPGGIGANEAAGPQRCPHDRLSLAKQLNHAAEPHD